MDKKPTMKHNLHLTSVEGEPKTLTKEQYKIARVSLNIFALFVMRFLVQGIDSLALHIIYTHTFYVLNIKITREIMKVVHIKCISTNVRETIFFFFSFVLALYSLAKLLFKANTIIIHLQAAALIAYMQKNELPPVSIHYGFGLVRTRVWSKLWSKIIVSQRNLRKSQYHTILVMFLHLSLLLLLWN